MNNWKNTKSAVTFIALVFGGVVALFAVLALIFGPPFLAIDLLFEKDHGVGQAVVAMLVLLFEVFLIAIAVGLYQDWKKSHQGNTAQEEGE